MKYIKILYTVNSKLGFQQTLLYRKTKTTEKLMKQLGKAVKHEIKNKKCDLHLNSLVLSLITKRIIKIN